MANVDKLVELFAKHLDFAVDNVVSMAESLSLSERAEIVGRIVNELRDGASGLEIFLRNEESLRRLRDEAATKEGD